MILQDVLQRYGKLSDAMSRMPELNKRILHEVFALIGCAMPLT